MSRLVHHAVGILNKQIGQKATEADMKKSLTILTVLLVVLLRGLPVSAGTTWDGAGANTNINTATNWDDNANPLFDGTVSVTFGTGGTRATINTNVSFLRLIFNRDSNFTVAAGAGTLTVGAGGIDAAIPGSTSRTYTISENVILGADQTWTATNNGAGTATLTVSGAVSGAGRNLTVTGTGNTNISGVIGTGTGSLTKTGTGILTLTGTNTYSGGTTLLDGTLRVGNNSALGTGTLTIDGGTLSASSGTARTIANDTVIGADFTLGQSSGGTGALTLSGAMDLGAGLHQVTVDNASDTISGVISGTGGITKAGTGTLILTGANTYTGGTTVSEGTLQVGAGSGLPAGTAVTLGNTAGATLDLNNLDVTIGSLAGGGTTGGNVTLGTGTLTIGGSGTGIYAGVISGTGGLTKTGTGTLVLSGVNTYTGTTTLDGGSLAVTGSITSPVVINPSGVLTSNSNIIGNVTNNGKVAPGNSIGVITITGNYTHNPGSVYEVETDPEGQSDKLIVTGTATLGGGTVSVLTGSGVYKMRTYYTILTAGNVTGAFANVASDLAYLTPSLSYDGNNVYLLLARSYTDFSSVAYTGNQRAVASSLDRISTSVRGDMEDVVNAVLGLSAPGARGAYEQMGGLSHTALGSATFSSFRGYMGTMAERSRSFVTGQPSSAVSARPVMLAFKGGDRASDAGNTLLAVLDGAGGTDSPYRGLWVRAYGGTGDKGGGDAASRYGYNTAGVVAGFDRQVANPLFLGMSLGYSSTRASMRDLTDEATVSSYQAGLYGMYRRGPWYLSSTVAYGYNRYDTQRDISFGEIVRSARARYDGHALGGCLETGYRIATRGADIIPLVALTGGHLIRDGFQERNAGAVSLDVDGERSSFLLGSLGVILRNDYVLSPGTLTPEIRMRWDYDLAGSDDVLNARFAGLPLSTFTTRSERGDRNSFVPGFGLTLRTKENVYFQITYDGSFSSDSAQHRGTLGLRHTWQGASPRAPGPSITTGGDSLPVASCPGHSVMMRLDREKAKRYHDVVSLVEWLFCRGPGEEVSAKRHG